LKIDGLAMIGVRERIPRSSFDSKYVVDGFGANDLHYRVRVKFSMYKANPVRPAQSKGAWLELEAWPADGG